MDTSTPPLTHRASGISKLTGLSKQYIYKLIADGELPASRIGTAVVVPHDDLVAFIERHRIGGARHDAA